MDKQQQQQQLVNEVERADADVRAAKTKLDDLNRDDSTEVRALARLRVDAREQLEIMHERHAAARERLAAHAAAERAARIAAYRAEAAGLREKAAHAEKSAVGQLIALYGAGPAETLTRFARPLNVLELERQAANADGMAEQLEVEK